MPSENDFLSGVIVEYQEAMEDRLAVFTAATDADVSAIKPTRAVRITDGGIGRGGGFIIMDNIEDNKTRRFRHLEVKIGVMTAVAVAGVIILIVLIGIQKDLFSKNTISTS